MTVQQWIQRHYSPAAGQSPVGHAVAVMFGLALIAIGGAFVISIVFLPPGVAIGVLGALILGAGIFGHIMSPIRFTDLLDTLVGLSGAAITLALVIAVIVFLAGFSVTVFVTLFRWLVA